MHLAIPAIGLALLIATAAPAAPASRYDIGANLARLKARPVPAEWSFAVAGDSRGGLHVLEAVMGGIERSGAAFTVFTGDLVPESTTAYWDAALESLDRSVRNVPVFPVVGNHETYKEGIGRFLQAFGNPSPHAEGPIDYAFDYGGARFVMMDNSRSNPEGFTDAQMTWLDKQLAGAPALVFVAAHKPPYTARWEHAFGNNAKRFMATLEKYKVTGALFGHIHFYDRADHGGVTYLIAGGAGAPLYHWDGDPDAGNPKFFASPKGVKAHNYAIVTVKGKTASFKVFTDQAKLAKLKPKRSAGIDLSPADFELWDAGDFRASATAREAVPAGK
ncbi:MAG: metallophosphoesterase [Candidatus Sericytochromatia bacterium]|nr:metallophosphoesterase [Candidatus Tanganyikabacteria bacterium]